MSTSEKQQPARDRRLFVDPSASETGSEPARTDGSALKTVRWWIGYETAFELDAHQRDGVAEAAPKASSCCRVSPERDRRWRHNGRIAYPHIERAEARLRAVAFPVYDVAQDGSCGHPAFVGMINHGADVSVRIQHAAQPVDYGGCWRFVESRAVEMEPELWRASGLYSSLRRAVGQRHLTRRLLGESTIPGEENWRGLRKSDLVVEDVDVLIDGETHHGQMAQEGPVFACYLLLPDTRVTLSGCQPPDRMSVVQVEREQLMSMPRMWGSPETA